MSKAVSFYVEKEKPKRIRRNRCQCAICLDIIESKHRHHFVSCKCGEIFTDGGKDYIRRGAKNLDNIIPLDDYD